MKKYFVFLLVLILFSVVIYLPAHSREVDIDITRQRLTKTRVGFTGFTPSGRADRDTETKLSETMVSDLTLVSYFEPVHATGGVDLSLNCSYSFDGRNTLIIEGKLYETKRGQMIFGKRFSGPVEQHRALVHMLTDGIINAATGESGITHAHLVFEGKVQGEKQLFISDFDGANMKQLTRDPCPNLFPRWSPDGNSIVYTSYLYNFPQTFIYNAREGTRSRVCGFPGLNTSASFSPNGQRIALTLSKDGNPEVYVFDIRSKELTRLTNDKGVDTSPVWSPDERQIAFVSNRAGSPQIYVMDSQGRNVKRLTYTRGYNTNPCWSPKGNVIVFNSFAGGVFQIFMVDVNTGETTQITNINGSCEGASFAPDGRHIVFSVTKGYNSELYIMDIFFREPRKLNMRGGNYTYPSWGPLKK